MPNNHLKNKSIALLIWNTDKEYDAHVYIGKIDNVGDDFVWLNEDKGWRVSLDKERLADLKEVPEDMKDVFLHADYFITLSISDLPDDDSRGLLPTGMKWH